MKRVLIAIQWLVVATFFIFLFFFIFRKDPPPDYEPSTWRSWTGFYALSVEGVLDSDDPRYLTPAKLDEYLRTLKTAGYKAITPEDIEAYYYNDKPLPEKAVFLMFEGGRKDHIVRATPRLIQNEFIGTLFVPTSVTRKWGSHFVSLSNLRRISRSANWRLGSMGHDAVTIIETSRDDDKGHFLTSRQWKRRGSESDGTFQERVFRDYEKAASILSRAAGKPAVAYLYPYADAGAGRNADPLAESINQGAVRQYHTLAFTQEGCPVNGYLGDPLALSRLRLRGDSNGEDLVSILESWRENMRPVESFNDPRRWQLNDESIIENKSLRMQGGGSIVLRGSGAWENVSVDTTMSVSPESMAVIYLRYSGPHSFLCVTLQDSVVRVQEKRAGKLQTLSRLALTTEDVEKHRVAITLKNNRLWVDHNGDSFAIAVPVSEKTKSGQVRIEARGNSVECSSFEAGPLPSFSIVNADYLQLNAEDKKKATALLPYWYEASGIEQLTEKQQSAVMLAAQDGVVTIPVIKIGARMNIDEARELAARVADRLSTISARMLIREFAVTGYQPEVHHAFREMDLKVSYAVTVDEAENMLEKGTQLSRQERMFVLGNEARVLEFGKKCEGVFPPGRLVLQVGERAELPQGIERAVVMEAD